MQAHFLRDLNRSSPESVVELYESGKVAATEANLGEYLKVRVRARVAAATRVTNDGRGAMRYRVTLREKSKGYVIIALLKMQKSHASLHSVYAECLTWVLYKMGFSVFFFFFVSFFPVSLLFAVVGWSASWSALCPHLTRP